MVLWAFMFNVWSLNFYMLLYWMTLVNSSAQRKPSFAIDNLHGEPEPIKVHDMSSTQCMYRPSATAICAQKKYLPAKFALLLQELAHVLTMNTNVLYSYK